MPHYRDRLPQLNGDLFLTDGGLETTLIFEKGINLPGFAAFILLENEFGQEILKEYYRQYADIAMKNQTGFILESMTWRANKDWGEKLGYSPEQLAEFNRKGIVLLEEIRDEYRKFIPHIVISGCMGPHGDGYNADLSLTAEEAESYHRTQIATFRETNADMVAAFTMSCIPEAIGIARAARSEEMPVVISYTVETDGRLPSGESLRDGILEVDAATDNTPVYYMVNCAHPTHFINVLNGEPWTERIRAVRSNASAKSHAELDEATELDSGDAKEFSKEYVKLTEKLTNLNVLGGCCGTDHRHVTEICGQLCNKNPSLKEPVLNFS